MEMEGESEVDEQEGEEEDEGEGEPIQRSDGTLENIAGTSPASLCSYT
jgi:hypothetical protein